MRFAAKMEDEEYTKNRDFSISFAIIVDGQVFLFDHSLVPSTGPL